MGLSFFQVLARHFASDEVLRTQNSCFIKRLFVNIIVVVFVRTVDQLEDNMYLRKITFILIITIIASFSIRMLGTIFPQIFQNILIVKATILINALFILSPLFFWLVFYWEYIAIKKISLNKICRLAIFGSFAVSIIYMKKLPFVFGLDIQFPLFLMNSYFDVLVPLISSAFHLIFFCYF